MCLDRSDEESPPRRDLFEHMRVLVLNKCGLSSWRDVALLEKSLPRVEELYLADNPNLHDVDTVCHGAAVAGAAAASASASASASAGGFGSLRVLDLSACGLRSWSAQGLATTERGPSGLGVVPTTTESPSIATPLVKCCGRSRRSRGCKSSTSPTTSSTASASGRATTTTTTPRHDRRHRRRRATTRGGRQQQQRRRCSRPLCTSRSRATRSARGRRWTRCAPSGAPPLVRLAAVGLRSPYKPSAAQCCDRTVTRRWSEAIF